MGTCGVSWNLLEIRKENILKNIETYYDTEPTMLPPPPSSNVSNDISNNISNNISSNMADSSLPSVTSIASQISTNVLASSNTQTLDESQSPTNIVLSESVSQSANIPQITSGPQLSGDPQPTFRPLPTPGPRRTVGPQPTTATTPSPTVGGIQSLGLRLADVLQDIMEMGRTNESFTSHNEQRYPNASQQK